MAMFLGSVMELNRRTFGHTLYKDHRGYRMEWPLIGCWFLNSYSVNWGMSNKDAKVYLVPALSEKILLASVADGKSTRFDFVADQVFNPILLGQGSKVVLEVPKGKAKCAITLDCDCSPKED